MFESIRFQWNAQLCSNYVNQLERILKSGDDVLIKDISEKALKHGRRALELGAVMDKPEIMVPLKDVLTHVGSIYEHMQQKERVSVENDQLRQTVKRQYVQLGAQMKVTGAGKPEDFIADRMVDMYRIATDRLDSSPEVLKMIYIDNEDAPKPLRDVIGQYVDGKLTKDQATEKLTELKSRTEQYVRELGANPAQAQKPVAMCYGQQGLEDKLKSEIVADSMGDDGTVDQKQLFTNTAEITMYSTFARLAKQLDGRQPTSEELIDAQVAAYKATHESNPTLGFKNDAEFNIWIDRFEQMLKSKGDSYLQVALPLYDAVVERMVK